MPAGHYTRSQLKAFSDCLNRIYEEPTGENPTQAIFDAITELLRFNSIGLNLVNQHGLHHLADRGMSVIPDLVERVPHVAADHPGIQWSLKHGPPPAQRLSDFVTERQLRNLSVYELFKQIHPTKDQAVILTDSAEGLLAFIMLRDKVFTDEEFFLLQLLQPHIRRVLNRCALFATFPGNDQLTPREREVLFWMSQGKKDDEIAFLLNAGIRTIHAHVQKILTKLGVENRATAIAMLLSNQVPVA